MPSSLLNGYAGVSSVVKAGFDYHNSTRTTGDAKDFILGSEIGQVLSYAHVLKKPICILLQTDGGIQLISSKGQKIITLATSEQNNKKEK